MATGVGTEGDIGSMLRRLIELDFDAAVAYRTAVDRLSDPTSKYQLSSFQRDHERHVEELSAAARALGERPPRTGDLKRVLTQGKVVLAALAGDKAILWAMKTNEDDINAAYERATSRPDVNPELRDVLTRGLQDERRHRDWIVSRIDQIEAGEAAAAHL